MEEIGYEKVLDAVWDAIERTGVADRRGLYARACELTEDGAHFFDERDEYGELESVEVEFTVDPEDAVRQADEELRREELSWRARSLAATRTTSFRPARRRRGRAFARRIRRHRARAPGRSGDDDPSRRSPLARARRTLFRLVPILGAMARAAGTTQSERLA